MRANQLGLSQEINCQPKFVWLKSTTRQNMSDPEITCQPKIVCLKTAARKNTLELNKKMVNEKKKENNYCNQENEVRVIFMKNLSNLVFSEQLAGTFSKFSFANVLFFLIVLHKIFQMFHSDSEMGSIS